MFFNLILEQKENKAKFESDPASIFRSLGCPIPFALRGWAFRLPFVPPQP
jgi:hypothetical protein